MTPDNEAVTSLKPDWTLEKVREYYGRVLNSTKDLKTSACCSAEALPPQAREIAKLLHDEVVEKFYGCGSPIPNSIEGATVLDLGCGSGRDSYILSKLVGPTGKVIGVDMTDEQLEVARRHQDFHAKKFGYSKPNTTFLKGFIEDLESVGVESNSVDLVVSNCVCNLSPDKKRLFREIFRVLKPGGELYFSDVYANRRLLDVHREDPVLLGECLGGALYYQDFRRILLNLGIRDFRKYSTGPIALLDPEVIAKIGHIGFDSITIRAFKLELEDQCEDYGQSAEYLGTMKECPNAFVLDDHHVFETGKLVSVCRNTSDMLMKTRFAKHFRIHGSGSVHYGLFPCGPTPEGSAASKSTGACC